VQTQKFKSLSIIIYLKKVLVFGLLFDEIYFCITKLA
jgi:hypothetical protein